MQKNIQELYQRFNIIKNAGYIKEAFPYNKGNSGLTFEKALGKRIDCFQYADFEGIEIKVKNFFAEKSIGLFSLVPSNSFGIKLNYIREKYGYFDNYFIDKKIFIRKISAKKYNCTNNKFFFKLTVSYEDERIFLNVYDSKNKIIDTPAYWDFDDINGAIERKLKTIAIINYKDKIVNNERFFYYNKITFFEFKGTNIFYKLIEEGIITINFCLTIHRSGIKKGKNHDCGVVFKIDQSNFNKLYNEIIL